MVNLEKKTVRNSIQGIGDIEVSVIQLGNPKWLKEIELFVSTNPASFIIIAMQKPELKNPLFLQRVIQAFVTHIQSGGEEQHSNQIRNHFRNWLYKQNGSLNSIIYGQPTTSTESTTEFRSSVNEEFNRRRAARKKE